MINSIDIITMIKVKHGNVSNRKLSKIIGLNHASINGHFKGRSLSIDWALKFADELGLDKRQVLVGNLCEKKFVTQEARDILFDMVGEKYQPKTDRLTLLLANIEKNRKNV